MSDGIGTRLDRFFEVTARGSTVGTELRGGLGTFIAMAYILVRNPIILSPTKDKDDWEQMVAFANLQCMIRLQRETNALLVELLDALAE